MTPDDLDLFGIPEPPELPGKPRAANWRAVNGYLRLVAINGVTEGRRCRDCAHLQTVTYSKPYHRCRLLFPGAHTATASKDHRLTWAACGKFDPSNEPGGDT